MKEKNQDDIITYLSKFNKIIPGDASLDVVLSE